MPYGVKLLKRGILWMQEAYALVQTLLLYTFKFYEAHRHLEDTNGPD